MKLVSRIHLFCLMFLITLSACSNPIPVENGVSLALAEHRKHTISDINYTLFFDIPESQQEKINASSTITFMLSSTKEPLQIDFRSDTASIKSVQVNGNPSNYTLENEHLVIPRNELLEGENYIDIDFIAGESSLNRNPDYLYTLFVPDRARTAFPLFDQPNLKATFDLSLSIPTEWKAIANAPLKQQSEQAGNVNLTFETSDLIPSYLFSFVAGKFTEIKREINGTEMTMLHRESDEAKVERNLEDIFELHASSLVWLEDYTNIDYPFKKFDFALIPSFQYGGMEHVGAILYNASSLFLDESPSDSQLLGRASLIAHETAHMWFGNLVTMHWFNDVWTKEVFANFMAAKIVNPSFPDINHDLNFLLRHYPSAYGVDRTTGANSIRQNLGNLNEAGQMYGAIIYNKAPIMMRQLEMILGEDKFQEGMQEYLSEFSYSNATWPNLIEILDSKSEINLTEWSKVWVETPGRPIFSFETGSTQIAGESYIWDYVIQTDKSDQNRIWSQTFDVRVTNSVFHSGMKTFVSDTSRLWATNGLLGLRYVNWNADGKGYGLFPAYLRNLEMWIYLTDVEKGSELINLYENMLEGNIDPLEYFNLLLPIVGQEQNQLILNQGLGQLSSIYWSFISEEERLKLSKDFEDRLWSMMISESDASKKKTIFNTYRSIALSDEALENVYAIWNKDRTIENLNLSENDFIGMAQNLAIKLTEQANQIVEKQLENIKNTDSKRRFEFLIPSLSPNTEIRDEFFESLSNEENRAVESWVLGALGNLHHPLRIQDSEKYILPSLELLQEIQITGDIFFPTRWLNATLGNHRSNTAVETVNKFLADNPEYNAQLKMKILQSADDLFRSNKIIYKNN